MSILTRMLLVILFSFMQITNGWVFTEVRYDPKWGLDDGFDDSENEIEPFIGDDNELKAIGQERINLIYPGTKWCGSGDVADGYDDLGPSKEADACCREHDHCPDVIVAGQTNHNLTNDAFYTKLSCDCDEEFRQCLHKANTSTARQVGKMYFNVIGTQCFREDHPITGCQRHSGWFKRKCVQYTYNENGEKLYQWFDVPNY